MEGLPILLFVAFVVASMLEKVLKKPPEGGPPRPGQRPPPGSRLPRPTPAERARQRREQARALPRARAPQPPRERPQPVDSGRADEMIPDDLWQILTGQPRPAPRPEPADLPSWDEAAVLADEAGEDEEAFVETARALDDFRREEVVRELPRIVSLETMPLPPERRHAAYHARVEKLKQAESVELELRTAARPHQLLHKRLLQRSSLRDAVILTEVLGRPKGLE